MGDIFRLGVKLFIITLVAGIALSFTNIVTQEPIAAQIQKENDLARKAALNGADSFTEMKMSDFASGEKSKDIKEVYAGKSGDKVVGYTIKLAPKGYGGPVDLTVGITTDGKLAGIRVGSNQETPGLGAKSTEPKFQDQYKGKPIDKELVVVKTAPKQDNDIQAITGATITSRAVTLGVNTAIEFYKQNLSK